jgi:hypothetical protein
LVLAALAIVVTSLAAFAGPAMADDWDWNDDGFFFEGNGFGDFDQEAESGDIDQSFDVSGTGDSSNQTVGGQEVANIGNTQNVIDVVDIGSFGDFDGDNGLFFEDDGFFFEDDGFFRDDNFEGTDFEFEDVGSTIEVSPTQTTTSGQQVNQAASAFGS